MYPSKISDKQAPKHPH